MNQKLVRQLVRLYPFRWRVRYGTEFEEFLKASSGGARGAANVVWAAISEQIWPTVGRKMSLYPRSFGELLRRPSAFFPMILSLIALTVVFAGPAIFGDLHATDEGPSAHIWQLSMAGQMPILAFFAIRWMPRATRQTLQVLAVHAGGLLANLAAVFLLGLG